MTLEDKLGPDDETKKMFKVDCVGYKTKPHIYFVEHKPSGGGCAYCPSCKVARELDDKSQTMFVQKCEGFMRERHTYTTKHYSVGLGNIYCPGCMSDYEKLHPPQRQPDFKTEWKPQKKPRKNK